MSFRDFPENPLTQKTFSSKLSVVDQYTERFDNLTNHNLLRQTFEVGQEVVLIRDLTLGDLSHSAAQSARGSRLAMKAGAIGTVRMVTDNEDGLRVSFPREAVVSSSFLGTLIASNGNWYLGKDLVQPLANKRFLGMTSRFTVLYDSNIISEQLPAGRRGIVHDYTTDEQDCVSFRSSDEDGDETTVYVKWFSLYPTSDVTPAFAAEHHKQAEAVAPEPLFGLYARGTVQYFNSDDKGEALVVVATRDVTQNELRTRQPTPVSATNPVRVKAGQMGYLRAVHNTEAAEKTQLISVYVYDQKSGADFWLFGSDEGQLWVPLLSRENGAMLRRKDVDPEMVTKAHTKEIEALEQEHAAAAALAVASCFEYKVGDVVNINGPINLLDEDREPVRDKDDYIIYDMAFRDGDEVYILEVDTSKTDEDDYCYCVGHLSDSSGITTWVRSYDLSV